MIKSEEAHYMTRTPKKTHENLAVFIVIICGLILPLAAVYGVISVEIVNMFGRYLTFAIVAIGLNLVWGYTGILSLAQSLFFAIGGYAMGMYLAFQGKIYNGIPEALYVVYPYGVGESRGEEFLPWYWLPFESFNWTIILGLLIPCLIAGLIGWFGFSSRVKGVYFSILTQALTVAAMMLFSKNEMKFCGTNGLTGFTTMAGMDLRDPNVKILLYMITFIALILTYLISRYITNTRFGRVLKAVNDSETTLRFSGYKPFLFKTAIFAIGGLFAGLGGLLYTPQANIITPTFMEAKWSILMVVWVAVGGRGSLAGSIMGAIGINLLYNFLTSQWSIGIFTWSPEYWPIVLGLLFVVVVLVLPGGIKSLWDKLLNTFVGGNDGRDY